MLCPSCGNVNLPGADECTRCRADLSPFDMPMGQNLVEKHLIEDPVWKLKPNAAIVVRQTDQLGKALQLMVDAELGAILVVDERDKLVGILTERDFLMKVVGLIENYIRLPVGDFMTSQPETVQSNDTVAYAMQKMDLGGYRHLPVVENGKPVGVVSVRNLLRYVTRLCKEPLLK